jgi:hypothetical protein
MRTLHLTLTERGATLKRHFTRFPVSLGRHPLNDLTLPDERVSRFHAELDVVGNSVVLHDRGTTNGTFVLSDTDVGRIRKTSFRLEREVEFAIEGFYIRATLSETLAPDQTTDSLGNSGDIANELLAAAGRQPHLDESLAHFEYASRTVDDLVRAQVSLRRSLSIDATPGSLSNAADNVEAYLSATITVLQSLQNSLNVVRRRGLHPEAESQSPDTVLDADVPSEVQARPTVPDVALDRNAAGERARC